VHRDSEKGLTGPTSLVLSDITSFIKSLCPPKPDIPLFVMGHSMGGAEVLTYMADGDEGVKQHVRGWLLESPFVAFNPASKPSPIVVFVGRLAGRLLPHRQMVQKLDPKLLCRDEQVQKDFVADTLCHDTGTLEGLSGMLDRAAGLDTGTIIVPRDAGEGGKTRVWLSHGTKDGVCDYHGSERLYKRWYYIEDKELKELDGWLHKRESLFPARTATFEKEQENEAANMSFSTCRALA
jgi:acylglycerol lipase